MQPRCWKNGLLFCIPLIIPKWPLGRSWAKHDQSPALVFFTYYEYVLNRNSTKMYKICYFVLQSPMPSLVASCWPMSVAGPGPAQPSSFLKHVRNECMQVVGDT